jgi:hypothetical protein
MGDGPPYPNPISFDHQLAQAAIDALNAAVRQLQDHTTTDVANGNAALDRWQGPHGDRFRGTEFPWIQREAGRIVGEMQKMVGIIQRASEEAVALQRQHDQANQAWRDKQKQPPATN